MCHVFFFFSSRRRHTRCSRDWSSDVCSSDLLPGEITVYFHSENGILGMGRRAKPGEEDYDLVDAMKIPVTLIPGASFFHQADAHLMTRGGHLDVAVLGGFQVSEKRSEEHTSELQSRLHLVC